jgi:glycosyltransferase involved in cell wall biosynthesis
VEETFGLTTAEALACGTPAIVYNATACPEIICSKTGIVVEKNDINGLLRAINEIRFNGKDKYSLNCRQRAIEKFDKKRLLNEYFGLFEELIKLD